ncbi:uncharacterized protein LOC125431141 isoform X3 [Sphaerodactylus townsendi]|nr:uncharacterized protein LOC125431141 isoform X3 [Sphaerodactylus townsendi]
MVKERALQSVQLGYTDVLDYLVRNQQLDLGVVDEKNRNLLFLAAVYDQSKVLDYFLEMTSLRNSGWSNQAAENGNTPLHAAVNTGKMHLVSLLLHYPGINVNVPNPQCDGATPLHLAIVYGQLGVCYLLLNAVTTRKPSLRVDAAASCEVARVTASSLAFLKCTSSDLSLKVKCWAYQLWNSKQKWFLSFFLH